MKHDSRDNSRHQRRFRYAVLSLAALVVLSLGFTLVPAEKPVPSEPPFSERARAAALEDALDLRASGMELAAADAAHAASVDTVVTLLTIQARALLAPTPVPGPAATEAAPPAASSAASAPSASDPAAEPGLAGFAAALMASGTERVKDAQEADGGMARLLAGTGTAQLLAAARLGATAGGLAGAGPAGGIPAPEETGPSCPAVPAAEGAGPGAALAAAVAAEQQAVYGYQAALPRLAPTDAGTALAYLGQHSDLADAAGVRLRLSSATAAPQQPGYVLDAQFLAAPAAGLGRLEAATLAAYGDLVALSQQGPVRAWAVAALQSAAGRAAHWGADPGPVPGLPLEEDQLPGLPTGQVATPSPAF
ncbi:DUF4439 domain-containing protein [Arthrobacter sp. C152]